jgi:hypothetical protein
MILPYNAYIVSFWAMPLGSLVGEYSRFRGTHYYHLQGMKMEVVHSSEMLETPTRLHSEQTQTTL